MTTTQQHVEAFMIEHGFHYQAPGTTTASAEWWKTNDKGEFVLYMTNEQATFMWRIATKARRDGLKEVESLADGIIAHPLASDHDNYILKVYIVQERLAELDQLLGDGYDQI